MYADCWSDFFRRENLITSIDSQRRQLAEQIHFHMPDGRPRVHMSSRNVAFTHRRVILPSGGRHHRSSTVSSLSCMQSSTAFSCMARRFQMFLLVSAKFAAATYFSAVTYTVFRLHLHIFSWQVKSSRDPSLTYASAPCTVTAQ